MVYLLQICKVFLSGGLVVYWKRLELLNDDFDFIF